MFRKLKLKMSKRLGIQWKTSLSFLKRLLFPSTIFFVCHCMTGTGPDRVMVRAFASETGGAGSNSGRVIPKKLKMVPVATLLGAQH